MWKFNWECVCVNCLFFLPSFLPFLSFFLPFFLHIHSRFCKQTTDWQWSWCLIVTYTLHSFWNWFVHWLTFSRQCVNRICLIFLPKLFWLLKKLDYIDGLSTRVKSAFNGFCCCILALKFIPNQQMAIEFTLLFV